MTMLESQDIYFVV